MSDNRMVLYATYRGVNVYRDRVYQFFEAEMFDGYAIRSSFIKMIEHIDTKIDTKNNTPTA